MPYDLPAMKNFQHFRLTNLYFKGKKSLYLKTSYVKVLRVQVNESRFAIGGYYLFVKSAPLKAKLMKIIKKWELLDSIGRKRVFLQFTNYQNHYWNQKEITVMEFDKYLRGRETWLDETTNIYKNVMRNVGIGVDYNPHRLWPKRAKITFEITVHTVEDYVTYVRVVARGIHFR